MKEPKKNGRKAVKDCSVAELEQDLARTKKALDNKSLLPLGQKFYAGRKKLIEGELARRS